MSRRGAAHARFLRRKSYRCKLKNGVKLVELPFTELEMPMTSDRAILPLAVPASSGSGGVSAPFSILPEQLAEQTEALGQAVIHLIASPPAEQREAAVIVTGRLEQIAHSFDRIYREANDSAQSLNAAIGEAFRRNMEQALQFADGLANAKGPAEALDLQFGYFAAQVQLFAEETSAIQREFAKVFFGRGLRSPNSQPATPPRDVR